MIEIYHIGLYLIPKGYINKYYSIKNTCINLNVIFIWTGDPKTHLRPLEDLFWFDMPF